MPTDAQSGGGYSKRPPRKPAPKKRGIFDWATHPAKPKPAPKKPAPKKPAPRVTKAPVSDVRSSGKSYGVPKAKAFKKTAKYKDAVVATQVEQGTARNTRRFNALVAAEVQKAHAGRPFDHSTVARAIELGKGKGLELNSSGDVLQVHRKPLLPDARYVLDPVKGGVAGPSSAQVKRASAADPVKAAGVKVLAQTARPIHAIAGAVDQAQQGKDPVHGLTEGLVKNKPYTFGTVLRRAGAPKGLAAVGGFGLDVALDPTTYLSGGESAVLKASAEKAAGLAAEKALKSGLSKAEASAAAEAAAAQVVKTAKSGVVRSADKGVGLRAGRKVVGAKTTAKIAGTARLDKAAARVAESRAGHAVRNTVADVNPDVVPAGVSKSAAKKATQIARTARATKNRRIFESQRVAVALRKAVGKDDQRVLDAIESGTIDQLPAHLQQPARVFQQHMADIQSATKAAGISTGDRGSTYVKHLLSPEGMKAIGKDDVSSVAGRGVGKQRIRPASSKTRQREGSLADLRVTHPGHYVEDVPQVFVHRLTEGHTAVTQAKMNQRLAAEGHKIVPGKDLILGPEEGVFRLKGSDLTEITDKQQLKVIVEHGGDEYRVLNRHLVERARNTYSPTSGKLASKGVGRGYDRLQGGFKRVATFTPGFHIRNLVGDTQNAYLAEGAVRVGINARHSAKALHALNKRENALGDLSKTHVPSTKGVKLAGRQYTYDELAQLAANHGAIRTGFMGTEIPELVRDTTKVRGKVAKTKAGRVVKETGRQAQGKLQDREDLMRLATFIGGLKKGMSPEDAASYSNKYHFDYGNLTDFERGVARRVMPFYTFTARNIPLQARTLVTRPGRYAQYEKLREEAINASGVQDQKLDPQTAKDLALLGVDPKKYASQLTEYQQRNLGVPVKVGGHTFDVSMGLPLTDLNEIPVSANPLKYGEEAVNKTVSMVTPILKDPLEITQNYSFFFRDKIESDESPLVAAPSWVGSLGVAGRKKLGVVKKTDKRTGKPVWKWPAKVNYAAHAMPGLPSTAQSLMSGTDRVGRGTGGKVLAAAGVKALPVDPVQTAINNGYQMVTDLKKRQQLLGDAKGTKPYVALSREVKLVQRAIYRLQKKAGYKVLPKAGAPKKGRGGAAFGDQFGGGLGSGSLGGEGF